MESFKERWIDRMSNMIKLAFPQDSDSAIRKYVTTAFDKDFTDFDCILFNNYEKQEVRTTGSALIDWIEKIKPIITESGTLFKQHDEVFNPNTTILQGYLDTRSGQKKMKFKYMIELNSCETDSEKTKYTKLMNKADATQLRTKIKSNSFYGVNGLSSSWFFNIACASATTARGQALISTATWAFEDFLADNVRFIKMDECLAFIQNIIDESLLRKHSDTEWVDVDITADELFERLKVKFIDETECNDRLLRIIINNISPENRSRIYYKSNLEQFIRHSNKAKRLIRFIINSNTDFVDPNKVPDKIRKDIETFSTALCEYVHYNYPTPDRVYRLRNLERKRVITIDTDSNFINFGAWYDFVQMDVNDAGTVKIGRRNHPDGLKYIEASDIYKQYSRKKKELNEFNCVNLMIYCTGMVVNNTLIKFLENANTDPNGPGKTFMKNEFLYRTVLLTPAKKHYQGAVRLQEGVSIPKCKLDVKGMEYRKPSMAGEEARTYFENLVFKDILMAENWQPNIGEILNKLKSFENKIIKSILNGEDKYLTIKSIKTPDGYKNPMSVGQYKAAYIWNYLYPNMEITLPGSAYIIKTKLNKPKDIAQLSATEPEIYKKLIYLMENLKDADENGKSKISAINSIAFPLDEKMPDWIKPYIDIDEIISSNTKLMYSVLNCLGCKTISRVSSTQFFSNIISM